MDTAARVGEDCDDVWNSELGGYSSSACMPRFRWDRKEGIVSQAVARVNVCKTSPRGIVQGGKRNVDHAALVLCPEP